MEKVKSFLCLTNYFRKFMPGHNRLVLPFIDLMRSNKAWKWTDKCLEAFEKVKYSLINAQVLPMPDFSKPFEVVADASKYTSSAVLM